MVIVPPYWGLPSLSHQFPVTEVVDVVVGTDVEVTFVVGAGTDEEMGKGVDVGIEVDVLQDGSSIVAASRRLKLKTKPLFFIFPSIFHILLHLVR